MWREELRKTNTQPAGEPIEVQRICNNIKLEESHNTPRYNKAATIKRTQKMLLNSNKIRLQLDYP